MEKRRSVGMQIDHPPDIFGRSDVEVCKAAKFAGAVAGGDNGHNCFTSVDGTELLLTF